MGHFCLVTGGLGFIGQHLVELLLERGDRVRIFDLATPAHRIDRVDYVTGNIVDRTAVDHAMDGIDRVFHLAANAGLWSPRKDEFVTINQAGTRNVMDAALTHGVERVVHCSTESILKRVRPSSKAPPSPEDSSQTALIDESIRLTIEDMAGAYCRGKFVAEQEAFAAASKGLSVVIVNPTVPIGPGDRRITPPTRMMLGFLNKNYPAYLNSTLNLIDARDVALGHILAADKGTSGERYILGNANIQLGELLRLLEELSGVAMPTRQIPYWLAFTVSTIQEFIADTITKKPPQAPLTGVKLARSPMMFNNTKAQTELGLTFRPLKESLMDAIADYQQRGLITA
ncbi:MAG: NAD-dependent epimerase/dehydratase family protein [Cyanobacteria bacterium J06627_8]